MNKTNNSAEFDNVMTTSADGSTDESTALYSLETSLDTNGEADVAKLGDSNGHQKTIQYNSRGVFKQTPLTTLDKTTSEDIVLNSLPSLNINSSSSIFSDSTAGDLKSPISSSELIDFYHPNQHSNIDQETQSVAQNFASEHRIFLRAALDMLAEREQLRMYADVNDPNNIIKSGTLRKASHRIKGVWKTKHVEIREGVFSYLSGSNKGSSSRKDVLLRASSCTCRAVKIRSVKIRPSTFGNGFVFELKIQGGSRRLWMANTKEERLSWMQAIHSAMIGASPTRSDNFLEYYMDNTTINGGKKKGNKLPTKSPYLPFLEQYIKVGEECAKAETKEEYLSALASLRGKSISVPVQWIKSQLDETPGASAFVENDISSCVEQLWKDLVRDSVSINGHVLTGESFHGPERILGKLTQQILFTDRGQTSEISNRISESQSVLYARNILLGADRTRTGGDSYYCAEHLCTNRDLVVICPSSTEANPLSITVHSSKRDTTRIGTGSPTELNIQIRTRSSSEEPWKLMYVILTENKMLVYEHSDTNRCQSLQIINLIGAKVIASTTCALESQTTGRIITIVTDEGGLAHEFLFEDEFDFFLWRSSIEKAVTRVEHKDMRPENKPSREQESKIDVTVNVSTEYKICTLDPQGQNEDTWGTIRTTFKQIFQLSGGPSGRISRGDEVVELELL